MDRSQKESLVSEMRDNLQQASSVIVAHQAGLTVSEVNKLRREMREAGAKFKVFKNTLAQIAVKGTPLESISVYFQGPTALAYSKDDVAAARVMFKFSEKNEKLSIIGGYLNGKVLNKSAITELATLPSFNELRSKIIGVICAPATKLAILAKEPAARLARVLAARN
jgi:large subunit ribosomal protein L10